MIYEFSATDHFDARKGYKRCSVPGVGVSFPGRPGASADFWRNPTEIVVVRFSSQGYQFSFELTHPSGGVLLDSDMEDFANCIQHSVLLWLEEGVDDAPSI
jgi:hypothetical protein